MKEKIYTIPVNDAFNNSCECPLCELEKKTISDLLSYYMGASIMEPDVRINTNEKGFCREHLAAMYNRQENRLGLALMLHTNLVETNKKTKKNLKGISKLKSKFNLFAQDGGHKGKLIAAAKDIEANVKSCALCERLEYTLDRYIDVIMWQFFEDNKFHDKFLKANGFCLQHLAVLIRGAAKYLSESQSEIFINKLTEIENNSLDTLEGEIKWFTQKFDYKNEDAPWGNSKDAVPRTIRKISGRADLKQ